MTANVIALSVQTGSGGFAVAHQVAERLGFRYYDWEITSEAAVRAGVSPNEVIAAERVPGFVERMMRRLGAASAVSVEGGPVFSELSPAAWSTRPAEPDLGRLPPVHRAHRPGARRQGDAVIVGHAGAAHTARHARRRCGSWSTARWSMRAERLAIEQEHRLDEAPPRDQAVRQGPHRAAQARLPLRLAGRRDVRPQPQQRPPAVMTSSLEAVIDAARAVPWDRFVARPQVS